MSETTTELKPKRRWYQYRLWDLFVLVTVAAIGCSWFACKMQQAERQRETVKAIENLGGWVSYNARLLDIESWPGSWTWKLPNRHFFYSVVRVGVRGQVNDTDVMRMLEHLRRLPELEELHVEESGVTQEAVQKLQQALPNCEIHD